MFFEYFDNWAKALCLIAEIVIPHINVEAIHDQMPVLANN
jgi:hypothetical protein